MAGAIQFQLLLFSPTEDALAGESRMEDEPSLGRTDSTMKGQGAALSFHGHGCGAEDSSLLSPAGTTGVEQFGRGAVFLLVFARSRVGVARKVFQC